MKNTNQTTCYSDEFEIDPTSDTIDSCAIIERIETLEDLEVLTDAEVAELAALQAIADDLSGYGDWDYGEQLIADSHFQEYMGQMINDCYGDEFKKINSGEWPFRHVSIDYAAAAEELLNDYVETSYCGYTFYMRA